MSDLQLPTGPYESLQGDTNANLKTVVEELLGGLISSTTSIIAATGSFVTNAAVNTDTTHTILAAGGVGNTYRLLGVYAGIRADMTGRILLRSLGAGGNSVGSWSGTLSRDGNGAAGATFPFPGVLGAANTAITIVSRSEAANQSFSISVLYVVG